jgi:hypothetical protein
LKECNALNLAVAGVWGWFKNKPCGPCLIGMMPVLLADIAEPGYLLTKIVFIPNE